MFGRAREAGSALHQTCEHLYCEDPHTQAHAHTHGGRVWVCFLVLFGARVNRAKKTCKAPVYPVLYPSSSLSSSTSLLLIWPDCVFTTVHTANTHIHTNATLAAFQSGLHWSGNTRRKTARKDRKNKTNKNKASAQPL